MAAVYQNFVKTKVLFSCCEQRSVAAAAFISLIYNQVVASSGLATACTRAPNEGPHEGSLSRRRPLLGLLLNTMVTNPSL